MQRRNRLAWVLGILLAMPGISWAQGFNGAITGVVKDSSGGVVPDAALTLATSDDGSDRRARPCRARKASSPSAT